MKIPESECEYEIIHKIQFIISVVLQYFNNNTPHTCICM